MIKKAAKLLIDRLIDSGTTPIPDYGDVMTIEEFADGVESEMLMDDDGHGHYSNGKVMYQGNVYPSEFDKNKLDKRFTHVVWFNK